MLKNNVNITYMTPYQSWCHVVTDDYVSLDQSGSQTQRCVCVVFRKGPGPCSHVSIMSFDQTSDTNRWRYYYICLWRGGWYKQQNRAGNFHCDLTRPHLNLRQFNTGVPNIRAVCRNWAGKDANRIWPTFNCIFTSFTAFLSANKNLLFYNYGSVSLMTTQSFFWYLTHLLLLDFLQQHCFVM